MLVLVLARVVAAGGRLEKQKWVPQSQTGHWTAVPRQAIVIEKNQRLEQAGQLDEAVVVGAAQELVQAQALALELVLAQGSAILYVAG